MKSSEINFIVNLDENNIPEKIQWEATDSPESVGLKACKAVMVSIWDPKEQNSLRIDLWTKDMMADEMKLFFHQTLVSMAQTLERATGEEKMAGDMRDFCEYFAERLNLYDEK
ncbi:MAG: gliding motility protein GldC [Bacteroidetes bacterium]|nr:gliding motility protein GldC [Bacteroidota bacterium]HET6245557.1 gliding motility protein GldC [Bacteroidia bacterium]